jgi:RNA polymerase sigma factor (TIGR02999 family)
MRRILVDQARQKVRLKRGGEMKRVDLDDVDLATNLPPDEFLLLNDAIDGLAAHDATAAKLLQLRYFAGLSLEEAAAALGVPRTTAYRHWTYARAWLISQTRLQTDRS